MLRVRRTTQLTAGHAEAAVEAGHSKRTCSLGLAGGGEQGPDLGGAIIPSQAAVQCGSLPDPFGSVKRNMSSTAAGRMQAAAGRNETGSRLEQGAGQRAPPTEQREAVWTMRPSMLAGCGMAVFRGRRACPRAGPLKEQASMLSRAATGTSLATDQGRAAQWEGPPCREGRTSEPASLQRWGSLRDGG